MLHRVEGEEGEPRTPGQYMRALRKAAGLSMGRMAMKLGVSVGFISDVEHDHRPVPLARVPELEALVKLDPERLRKLTGPCSRCGDARGERLLGLLRKVGQHPPECEAVRGGACSCGLTAALEGA